jgi:cbb3-type cytochrome oxidase maturation protein
MEILYLLVPLAVIMAGVIVWAFLWSIRSGQFDDLEGPAHRILMDEDDAPPHKQDNKPGRTKKPPRRH